MANKNAMASRPKQYRNTKPTDEELPFSVVEVTQRSRRKGGSLLSFKLTNGEEDEKMKSGKLESVFFWVILIFLYPRINLGLRTQEIPRIPSKYLLPMCGIKGIFLTCVEVVQLLSWSPQGGPCGPRQGALKSLHAHVSAVHCEKTSFPALSLLSLLNMPRHFRSASSSQYAMAFPCSFCLHINRNNNLPHHSSVL
ncbi:hypothetical protein GQ457_17G018360 [Hibiscus cannabinus]